MKIKIISVPPGNAPDAIREQWQGLEIPILGIEDPKKASMLRSGIDNLGGYEVSPKDAIAALEKAGRMEAVEFWTPFINAPKFVFRKDVCELIE